MIQELFGDHRKISITRGGGGGGGGSVLLHNSVPSPFPLPPPSSSSSSSSAPNSTNSPSSTTTTDQQNHQNLRCPRCDSSNTKFCYYNNYNLTQPRHFCKSCRRYWTKGGALRNVPIGGGCRKNHKAAATTTTTAVGRLIKTDYFQPSNPQSSHLFELLRSTSLLNPNSILNNPFTDLKEGNGAPVGIGTHLGSGLNQVSSMGSFWRNNQEQSQPNNPYHHQPQSGFSSTVNYYADHHHSSLVPMAVISNSSSSSSSTILESAPVGVGVGVGGHHHHDLGYWMNPMVSWSEHLPTTNGAYP